MISTRATPGGPFPGRHGTIADYAPVYAHAESLLAPGSALRLAQYNKGMGPCRHASMPALTASTLRINGATTWGRPYAIGFEQALRRARDSEVLGLAQPLSSLRGLRALRGQTDSDQGRAAPGGVPGFSGAARRKNRSFVVILVQLPGSPYGVSDDRRPTTDD